MGDKTSPSQTINFIKYIDEIENKHVQTWGEYILSWFF
jgi:hypothetical protein